MGKPVPQDTVDQLWERSQSRCEVVIDGIRCKKYVPKDRFNIQHIKSRGRLGSNNLINLMTICFAHHQDVEQHKGFWTKRYRSHFWQIEGKTEADVL